MDLVQASDDDLTRKKKDSWMPHVGRRLFETPLGLEPEQYPETKKLLLQYCFLKNYRLIMNKSPPWNL